MKMFKYIIIFLLLGLKLQAAVPRIITWQGRLMNQETGQPLSGTQLRNFKIRIRPVSQAATGFTTFEQTLNDVLVENGLFTLDLDLSQGTGAQLKFDDPYEIEVTVGPRNTGGLLGSQAFFTTPYAFAAENTLLLNGLPASSYVTSHSHDRLNVTSFVVDGSKEARSSVDQFLIKNSIRSVSDTVFKVNEDGNLTSSGGLVATSFIATQGGFQLRNTDGSLALILDNLGDMTTPTTASGTLSVGQHLQVTGSLIQTAETPLISQVQAATVLGLLSFQSGTVLTGNQIQTRMGQTHTIEQHINESSSSLQSALLTMVSGGIADDLHTHVWENGEVKSLPDNIVDSQRIKDGAVQGIHFSSLAAIQDSKLAQIATTGKVLLSALPAEVVQLSQSNDFRVAFPASVTDFDALKSKRAQLISTLDDRIAGAFPLMQLQDRPVSGISRFDITLYSSGDIEYSRPATSNTSWYVRTPGTKLLTVLGGQNLSFGPAGIFGSSLIQTDSVTGADFATGSIGSAALQTSSVQGADLTDFSLTTEKFAELETTAFAAGSILSSQIAEETLTNGDFAAGSITLEKVSSPGMNNQDFADRSIGASKVQSFSIDRTRFSSSTLKRMSGVDFASRSIGESRISSETSRRIGVAKLSQAVFLARTQPLNVRSSGGSGILTLRDNTANAHSFNGAYRVPFLELSIPQFVAGQSTAALQLVDQNQNQIFGLMNNGDIELGYDADSTPAVQIVAVTLTDRLLAVLAGVSDTSGSCGNGDSKMVPFLTVKATTSRRSDCISRYRNHGASSPSGSQVFLAAQEKCSEQGYRVCSMNQYYSACRKGLLDATQTYMTQDLASDTRVAAFQVQNANTCTNTTDFAVTSVDVTAAGQFYCCLRP